jgi:hypothetical protein
MIFESARKVESLLVPSVLTVLVRVFLTGKAAQAETEQE